jgi:antitoxin (DNA-binding transcriptional repressor) of toxin-antitoxin stability system
MTATISKSNLKAKMLEIFRELEATGGEITVTDLGRPVLKIMPIQPKYSIEDLFGDVQGQVI